MIAWLDDAIAIPGTRIRIGLDPILGLLAPGVGDGISAAAQLLLLWAAFRARVPRPTLVRMGLNIAIDAAVGALPFAGDLFDFGFKAGRRNLVLLERAQRRPGGRATLSDYAFVFGVIALVVLAMAVPVVLAGTLLYGLMHAR